MMTLVELKECRTVLSKALNSLESSVVVVAVGGVWLAVVVAMESRGSVEVSRANMEAYSLRIALLLCALLVLETDVWFETMTGNDIRLEMLGSDGGLHRNGFTGATGVFLGKLKRKVLSNFYRKNTGEKKEDRQTDRQTGGTCGKK